ncbi:hypothetical protein [Streptomyces sp. AK02-04a]|uniref:hypothetical protein n=1 Tax=Streptomyces sp. AK02-04a TaxID=3028649 RepID=UPI0029AB3444|nr:hypothetical protein [Streptomyces sp. AK02-04a]MDX3761910.1 hypothetical protein [Streptomyces sp. AK02-04a]
MADQRRSPTAGPRRPPPPSGDRPARPADRAPAADTAADNAEAAAGRARSEADAATQAAADAAATRAEAAAKRARSDADAAQAAKLKADAAVRTATSAAADAIKASQDAAAEANAAKNLADQAKGDAKETYTHAANAAKYAADARTYSKDALGYAADAAKAAAAAQASLARTIEYDRQAAADAAAADKAAGNAEGYAKDARDSADAAALDAEAARAAADRAEQDAKDARAAADRSDVAATEAEQAAKDADKYAKEAQDTADRTEREEANKEASQGAGTGIPGVFAVPDESTIEIVSSKQIGTCPGMPEAAFQGCNAKYDLVVTYEADFYLCTDDQAQATADGCPKTAWQFLQRATLKNIKIDDWTHKFSGKDIVRAGWQSLFGDVPGAILFSFSAEDLMDCWHGSKTACAWSIATYVPIEGLLAPISRAVKALDAAARTGIDFEDAFKALRSLEVCRRWQRKESALGSSDSCTRRARSAARQHSHSLQAARARRLSRTPVRTWPLLPTSSG